jgi:predicted RNA-binding protein with PIN domain
MSDLQARSAEFAMEEADGEFTALCGRAPVSALHGYAREVIAYTRGKGKLSCTSDGYEPCENGDEIAARFAYDPEADVENTPHSVFCAGGAGFIVPWQDVDEYKHIDADYVLAPEGQTVVPKPAVIAKKYRIDEDELEKIMLRLFGDGTPRKAAGKRVISAPKAEKPKKKAEKPLRHMIIVDGYNVIYAWESLKNTAAINLEDARRTLMDMLSNYVAFTKKEVVLVFDAYRVKDGRGSDFSQGGLRVVFTKQDETADAYIEKMMHDLGPDYSIRTVTGDRLVQFAALHSGVLRMTPKEFEAEVTRVGAEINDFLRKLEENR